jgi:large subunit ribosomal protein L22
MTLKTSIKKLGNLTRQIQHKDIDFAITQMRFSPKRVARHILRGLEHAKEEAIRLQEMKQGEITVDQAWVGRMEFMKQFWARARGATNLRRRPFTHFTVLLRSSKVVRERVAKVKQRKLEKLVRRPTDYKPIYNARPYYTW